MSRIERYNFILPETSIAHCIRCFIVDCSLYFSTICYVILSKSILQSFPPYRPPCGRAYRSEQDSLASRLRVQKYNKLPLPPNNTAEKFSKKFQRRDFDASTWQKSFISSISALRPIPPDFYPFLPRCATKNHKTASEINPTTSEVEKTTSEINPTTSEVITLHHPTSSRTRARTTRVHYTIIPCFLPSLPSPPTEKHLTTA